MRTLELGSTVCCSISLVIASHLLHSLCCTSISEQHTPPAVAPPVCKIHSRPQNTFFWYYKYHSGCNACHYSLLSPTVSSRFFPLPPLPSAAVQWGCYPRQRCCHHCTTPPTNNTTTASSSGKPLRLSSSNLLIKVLPSYDTGAPGCSINWGSRG